MLARIRLAGSISRHEPPPGQGETHKGWDWKLIRIEKAVLENTAFNLIPLLPGAWPGDYFDLLMRFD